MSTFETLRQLHNIIGSALSELEATYSVKNLDWPSLDKPFVPGVTENTAAQCVEATNKIVAAADQITATVRGPAFTLFETCMIYYLPACLRYIEQTHIVEILREAGPEGLHIDDIATRSDQNALKLGHALRYLATYHIFRELKPNVFANNRISSIVDTGKSLQDILADPAAKYDNTNGMAALVDLTGDETFKATAYLTETYKDPKTKHSMDPCDAPFQRAFNVDGHFFAWAEATGRVRRLGIAMGVGTRQWEVPEAVLNGFPWDSLPANSLLVDVGGGVGSTSLRIAQNFPHIRIVVQDRPMVITGGEALWKSELPDALSSGRVQFQSHDFFEPQPQHDASVFLLRTICNDWTDAFIIKILKQLRNAAKPHTKLLVGEHIIYYACPDNTEASNLPGAARTLAPAPLLANLGRANGFMYEVGLSRSTLLNSYERTLNEIVSVLKSAGWQVTNVHRVPGSTFSYLTAEIV